MVAALISTLLVSTFALEEAAKATLSKEQGVTSFATFARADASRSGVLSSAPLLLPVPLNSSMVGVIVNNPFSKSPARSCQFAPAAVASPMVWLPLYFSKRWFALLPGVFGLSPWYLIVVLGFFKAIFRSADNGISRLQGSPKRNPRTKRALSCHLVEIFSFFFWWSFWRNCFKTWKNMKNYSQNERKGQKWQNDKKNNASGKMHFF